MHGQELSLRRRYYTGEGWVPKKLDVLVEAPESLSLEHLRATGLQSGQRRAL